MDTKYSPEEIRRLEQAERRQAQADARRDAYIQRVVDAAPPLTQEQRARIGALLTQAAVR